MSFHDRRGMDDALDIHPETHPASVDSNGDGSDDRSRANATSSGHPVTVENDLGRDNLGSAHRAGAGSEVGEMDQANAASVSTNGSMPSDDSRMIRHVHSEGILNISSLRQPHIPVSCNFKMIAQA